MRWRVVEVWTWYVVIGTAVTFLVGYAASIEGKDATDLHG